MQKTQNKLIAAFRRLFNIGIPLKYALIVTVIFTVTAAVVTGLKVYNSIGGGEDYDDAKKYVEIKNILSDNYIDEVDHAKLGDYAAAAMVTGLGDQWSYYMSPQEYQTYQLYSANEYASIGLSIIKSDAGFTIASITPDSPAYKAGLLPGQIIVSIDGEYVVGKNADDVRTMIRAKLNTKIDFGIGSKDNIVTVDCSKTYVSPVAYNKEKTEAGYVKIDSFEAGSGQDAVDAIEDLLDQNAVSLVIDLRDNSGGLMSELQVILDYLLPKGDLFVCVDKAGHKEATKSDSKCLQLPMCVLINSNTSNAAEFFAATIQEYRWGTIVGEPTYGKTRVQETIELADGSAIRLSTATYLTSNGVDLSIKGGVVPDVIVLNTVEDEDAQLNWALKSMS